MARCEKIFIAGFSGSGKSSLLTEISRYPVTDWKYKDLDQEILDSHPQFTLLSQVIADGGWEKFRLLERQEIEKFLKEPGKGVMSLGGGAFTPLLWNLYGGHPKIKFCYLYSSFNDCWQRLREDTKEPRPLAQAGESVLRELYQARLAVYQLIPWKLVNESGTSLEELAQKFWLELE